jgi:hypothetical protein
MNHRKLSSRDDAGLRKLAGAMLTQALEDLNEGDEFTRAEAWQWLNGENEAGLSFALCCKLLGCRAEVVRRGLLPNSIAPELVSVPAHLTAQTVELAELLAS